MKHKIIKPDKDFELEVQATKYEYQLTHQEEEMYNVNIYWMSCVYYSPFMLMVDLSLAFDELKLMLTQWLKKRKKTIIYKNRTNETI